MDFFRLPFAYGALDPALNARSVRDHYEDNHLGYFNRMNSLMPQGTTPQDVLFKGPTQGPLYNNTAQYFIHNMWWENLTPDRQGPPAALLRRLGVTEADLQRLWIDRGAALFGAGWLWLTVRPGGGTEVVAYPNADLPQRVNGAIPVLVMDLWEHAYYCQYGTNRKRYLENTWPHINWAVVSERLAAVTRD